jgi:hypothetical protein
MCRHGQTQKLFAQRQGPTNMFHQLGVLGQHTEALKIYGRCNKSSVNDIKT